ncbi:MAG: hypothetical protein ACQEQI_06055, partial [Bacillota bacterium]
LISKVIIKSDDQWVEFKSTHKEEFKELLFELQRNNLFPDLSLEKLKDWIIFGCYPLHPATAFGLFNLAKLVAQNERTLFTFLSHKHEYSLNHFLEETDDEFPLLGLDQLYDYFLELIKQEDSSSRIYGVWKDAERSLQQLARDDKLAKRFLKALAVINIISDFNRLPPTPEVIRSNLNLSSTEFEKVESKLLDKKLIFYRKSLNQYQFFAGSDIDIEAKLEEVIKTRIDHFDPLAKLNQDYLLAPKIAHRYNFEHKMIRFFVTQYLSLDQLDEKEINNQIKDNYLDGKIFIILANSEEKIKQAQQQVQKLDCNQAIFIIPRQEFEFIKLLKEIDGLEYLLNQQDFLDQDPIIKLELESHLAEKKDQLMMKLNSLYNPTYDQADFYHQGQYQQISSKRELSSLVSTICEDVFDSTMEVNHEMINRNKVTGIMKRARREIIEKLLTNDELEAELGFSDFTAVHTLTRCVLVNNNILQSTVDGAQIVTPKLKENGREVVEEIKTFIDQAKDNPQSFAELYEILQLAPYGLRKGYLPILFAAYLREFRGRIVITEEGEDRELSPTIFTEIEDNPQRFKLGIDLWRAEKEEYIQGLEKIFDQYLDYKLRSRNRLKALWEAMNEYYRNLSHYVRNTEELSDSALIFKKILSREYRNSHQLFFSIIPEQFGHLEFNELPLVFKEVTEELDCALEELYSQYKERLDKLSGLKEYKHQRIDQKFIKWYQQLADQVKNHHFNWKVNTLFDLLKELEVTSEREFLDLLAKDLIGFAPQQWNDAHLDRLVSNLEEIFIEIANYQPNQQQPGAIKLSFFEEGDRKELTFDSKEISDLGEMLLSKVKSDLDNFGNSIDEQEKATILYELLKEEL